MVALSRFLGPLVPLRPHGQQLLAQGRAHSPGGQQWEARGDTGTAGEVRRLEQVPAPPLTTWGQLQRRQLLSEPPPRWQ